MLDSPVIFYIERPWLPSRNHLSTHKPPLDSQDRACIRDNSSFWKGHHGENARRRCVFVMDLHSSLCTLLGISIFHLLHLSGVVPSILISTLQPYDEILTQIQAISIDHSCSVRPVSSPKAHCSQEHPCSICLMKADLIFPLWLSLKLLMVMAFTERL